MKLAGIVSLLVVITGCSPNLSPTTDPGGTNDPGAPPASSPPGDAPPAARIPYPFILAHGLDGFKNIGPVDYFSGVADALTKDGHQVFTAQVDSYNSSEVRGAELQKFVESVLAQTGAEKVNLIGHSQG